MILSYTLIERIDQDQLSFITLYISIHSIWFLIITLRYKGLSRTNFYQEGLISFGVGDEFYKKVDLFHFDSIWFDSISSKPVRVPDSDLLPVYLNFLSQWFYHVVTLECLTWLVTSFVVNLNCNLDANTPPPAANPRSEQNTNTGSFEHWAL